MTAVLVAYASSVVRISRQSSASSLGARALTSGRAGNAAQQMGVVAMGRVMLGGMS